MAKKLKNYDRKPLYELSSTSIRAKVFCLEEGLK